MKKLMLLLSLAAIGFSCAKKDNNTAVTYQLNPYTQQCIDQSNGAVVPQQYCQGSGLYTYNAYGQCIVTATGQPAPSQQLCQQNSGLYSCVQATTRQVVSSQLCATTTQYQQYICIMSTTGQQVSNQLCLTTGLGGTGYAQQCIGYYLYNGQQVQCGTTYTGQNNCSGYTLTNQQGQLVQCL